MSDPPSSECQICGESPVTKVLYPAAIHFKGSGFYSTDYGRGSRKREGGSDGDAPSEGGKAEKADKPDKGKPKPAEA